MDRAYKKNPKILPVLFMAGLTVFLIGALFSTAFAGRGEDAFDLGNQAYAEGKYDKAATFYEQVIHERGYSAPLLYNLANAYYKEKDIGKAVLNYERALYLDPGNADALANLSLARKDFGLIPRPARTWQRFSNVFNLDRWAMVTSGALWVFCFLLFLRGIRPNRFRGATFRAATAFSLLVLLAGGTGVVLQSRNLDRGVVVQEHARLLVSPFDSAASVTSVNDGAIVHMAGTYKDYVRVTRQNGQSGWMKGNAVQPVVPSGEYGRTAAVFKGEIQG